MKRIIGMIMIVALVMVSFAGCKNTKGHIDTDILKELEGTYEMSASTEKDAYLGMALQIMTDHEGKPYLSIYDTCGNPGVEGTIKELDDKKIVVEINKEYYDGMPAGDWEEVNNELILSYNMDINEGTNIYGQSVEFYTLVLTDASSNKEKTVITFQGKPDTDDDKITSNVIIEVWSVKTVLLCCSSVVVVRHIHY